MTPAEGVSPVTYGYERYSVMRTGKINSFIEDLKRGIKEANGVWVRGRASASCPEPSCPGPCLHEQRRGSVGITTAIIVAVFSARGHRCPRVPPKALCHHHG